MKRKNTFPSRLLAVEAREAVRRQAIEKSRPQTAGLWANKEDVGPFGSKSSLIDGVFPQSRSIRPRCQSAWRAGVWQSNAKMDTVDRTNTPARTIPPDSLRTPGNESHTHPSFLCENSRNLLRTHPQIPAELLFRNGRIANNGIGPWRFYRRVVLQRNRYACIALLRARK